MLPGKTVLHDVTALCPSRAEDRLCWRYRRGQDHDHKPHQPVLRHRRRQDPVRRHQRQQDQKADLRRSLGVVLQDTTCFTGTVMENIPLRQPGCHRRGVYAPPPGQRRFFIRRLPDGYDTMLTGDGANLSQGQRQLISPIARAAISDPPVMIWTRPRPPSTPAPRPSSTGHGQAHGRPHGVCHRPPAVHRAQLRRIMVLEQGRIVSAATTTSCWSKRGYYYQLYTGAFERELPMADLPLIRRACVTQGQCPPLSGHRLISTTQTQCLPATRAAEALFMPALKPYPTFRPRMDAVSR